MSSSTLFEAPPIRSRPGGKRQFANRRLVPVRFLFDQQIEFGTPTPSDVFLLATGGIDDGTIHAAVVARSTNSDSRADLDVRRLALAGTRGLFGVNSVAPSIFAYRLQCNQSLSPPSAGQALAPLLQL